METLLKWLRRLLGPIATAFAGGLMAFAGAPPELVGVFAGALGQAAGTVTPESRPRELVRADEANRPRLAAACERFGRSVAIVWNSSGTLMTFRPKLPGYLHGLLYLMRTQRRLEEASAAMIEAFADLLLYGSTETHETAVAVVNALVTASRELSGHKQSSPTLAPELERLSLDVGDAVVMWRKAAQADLGAVTP